MNYDLVKRTLEDIILEAESLPESELETIPGTTVKVKRGRVKEFDVNAYTYYEHTYNQFITENVTPYMSIVYNDIRFSLNDEYYASKLFELNSAQKSDMTEFLDLESKMTDLRARYLSKTDNLMSVFSVVDKEQFNAAMKEMSDILDEFNSLVVKSEEIRTRINNKLIVEINSELRRLEEDYLKYPNEESVVGLGSNATIRAKDQEEYNALYLISQMLELANKKEVSKLVAIDGIMFISEEKKDEFTKLKLKTKFLKGVLVDSAKKVSVSEINAGETKENDVSIEKDMVEPENNQKIIEEIEAELSRLEFLSQGKTDIVEQANGKYISGELAFEYNNLYLMLNYLKNADFDNSKKVWDKFIISEKDETDFVRLLEEVNLFKEYNPNPNFVEQPQAEIITPEEPVVEEQLVNEENQLVIARLVEYLDELGRNVSKNNALANLDVKQTQDGNWIVLSADLEEANRVIRLINILSMPLVPGYEDVYGIGLVNEDYIKEFKTLVARIKFEEIRNKVPELSAAVKKVLERNKDKIKENKAIIKECKLKNNFASVQLIRILENQNRLLDDALDGVDLERVGSLAVRNGFAKQYKLLVESANEKIEFIKAMEDTHNRRADIEEIKRLDEMLSNNKKEIINNNKLINELRAQARFVEMRVLQELNNYLVGAFDTEDLELVDAVSGLYVKRGQAKGYRALKNDLEKWKSNNSELLEHNEQIVIINHKRIEELRAQGDSEELRVLMGINKILSNAFNSVNLQIVDGLAMDKDDIDTYKELKVMLEEIRKVEIDAPEQKIEEKPEEKKPVNQEFEAFKNLMEGLNVVIGNTPYSNLGNIMKTLFLIQKDNTFKLIKDYMEDTNENKKPEDLVKDLHRSLGIAIDRESVELLYDLFVIKGDNTFGLLDRYFKDREIGNQIDLKPVKSEEPKKEPEKEKEKSFIRRILEKRQMNPKSKGKLKDKKKEVKESGFSKFINKIKAGYQNVESAFAYYNDRNKEREEQKSDVSKASLETNNNPYGSLVLSEGTVEKVDENVPAEQNLLSQDRYDSNVDPDVIKGIQNRVDAAMSDNSIIGGSPDQVILNNMPSDDEVLRVLANLGYAPNNDERGR